MRVSWLTPALATGVLMLAFAHAGYAGEVITVKIGDLSFAPTQVKARVGDTIEWVNEDFIDHTATAKDDSFEFTIAPTQSARLVLRQSGTIAYYCRFHPNMTATINVE